MEEIKKINLALHERIKDIAFLPEPLTIDAETLTPTKKPKRTIINKKYKHLIESLYR